MKDHDITHALLAVALVAGCFAEAPRVAADASSEGGGSDASTGPIGTPTGGQGPALTDSTTDGSAGGDGEASSAAESDAFGSSDSSSGSSGGTTGSEASSSSGTTGRADPDPYGDCYGEGGEPLCPGSSCILDTGLPASACAPDCAPGCDGGGVCADAITDQTVGPVCLLPCSSNAECDDVCADTGWTNGGVPLYACMWT